MTRQTPSFVRHTGIAAPFLRHDMEGEIIAPMSPEIHAPHDDPDAPVHDYPSSHTHDSRAPAGLSAWQHREALIVEVRRLMQGGPA